MQPKEALLNTQTLIFLCSWTAVKSSEWSMTKLPSPTMAYTSLSPMAYLTPRAPETS